jgi:preprotein translocase subunit SecD
MGKKKSVVLTILFTIVIVVLCAITALPSFAFGVKNWNPAVMQFDLGMDLGGEYLDGHVGGGYYAYYYPDGVKPASEYVKDEEDEFGYAEVGALYVSKDPAKGIYLEDGTISADFQDDFNAAVDAIAARYAAKGYEDYRVAVVDGYAIRVELPASQISEGYTDAKENATNAIATFAATGELTLLQDDSVITELTSNDDPHTVKDIIKSITVDTQYEITSLKIKLTSYGKTIFNKYVTSGDSAKTLTIAIDGTQQQLAISSDMISGKTVTYSLAKETDKHQVETLCIALNSALNDGGFEVQFKVSDVRTFAPVYQSNSLYFVFGALLAVIVVLILVAIIKMGGFGVVNMYSTLLYVCVTALCYAFITGGVFPVTMGTVLVFIAGLVLVNAFSYIIYKAIKTEVQLGKTVESAVKMGYKKTLMAAIDVHAVLLLGSVALLIGAGGLFTVAIQAIIAVITSAALCLLIGRAMNYTFLSANKDQYKYFKFVREDDDDE